MDQTEEDEFSLFFWLFIHNLQKKCVFVPVLSWEGFSGVRVLGLPGDVSYAADHGVYLSDPQVLTSFKLYFHFLLFSPALFAHEVMDVVYRVGSVTSSTGEPESRSSKL